MNGQIIVTITGWEKYNARADVKHPTWFRMENDISISPALFGLLPEERWVWVTLMSQASKKSDAVITIQLEWFSWYTGASADTILSALQKLSDNGAVTYVDERIRTDTIADDRPRPHTSSTDRHTLQTDITNITDTTVAAAKPRTPTTAGSVVWESYSKAFEERYRLEPRRNSQTNSLCKRLVELLGEDEASAVAAFYVTSDHDYYVNKGHDLKALIADASKLRTEWKTGKTIRAEPRRFPTAAERISMANKELYEKVERGEA